METKIPDSIDDCSTNIK